MFDFKLVEPNPVEWNALVGQYPGVTLFHTAFWTKIVGKTYGVKGQLLQIFRGDSPVGVIPIWTSSKAGLKIVGSPIRQTATHFCGPLCNPDINIDEVIESFYAFAIKELGASYVDITLPHTVEKNLSSEWKIARPETFVLDLRKTEEEIWTSFEGRMRTAVRKAQKSSVDIQAVKCGGKEIGEFYKMLEGVHGRHGVRPVFPQSFYKHLLIPSTSNAVLYGAIFENRWISMALILKFKNWMNYHSAASLREFSNLGANNFLQWHVIRNGLKEGVDFYDLGAGSGIAGIEKFKRSMRPLEANYQKMWRASLIGNLARNGYEMVLPWLKRISWCCCRL
jgi:hypothetical protein